MGAEAKWESVQVTYLRICDVDEARPERRADNAPFPTGRAPLKPGGRAGGAVLVYLNRVHAG